MLRKVRLALAIIFFAAITALFLDFTGALHGYLGWMAKIQFLPALLAANVGIVGILLVLTLVFGRIYCSVICPLGVMQDVISWASTKRKRHHHHFSYSPAKSWMRYIFLALLIIALAAGISSITVLLAPYSTYGRIVQNLFQPVYISANNLAAHFAERADSYLFYNREVWIRSAATFALSAIVFALLIVLAWRNGRTWCNTVCPVGTLLGLASRFSLFRMHIDTDRCNNCGLCAHSCKASCIDAKNHSIDLSRCVACGNCEQSCRQKAITYRYIKPGKAAASNHIESQPCPPPAVDLQRRSFLIGAGLAAASATLGQEKKKVDGGLAVIEKKIAPARETRLVPAGALSIRNMERHCTACQLCVSVCPNNVLRPSTNIATLMQPEMSYERGYCRTECNKCGQVCPAGAIKPISVEEKSSTQIGHAVWIRKNCIPLSDGVECGNCARHCPAGAITMIPSSTDNAQSVKIPAIDSERCIGCGACENLCPSRPFSAIYVEGHEVHRTI